MDKGKTINQTITQLRKMFDNQTTEDLKIPTEKQEGFMDSANVCCFIPKNTRLKETFKNTFGFNNEETHKIPNINNDKQQSCKYSREYLKFLLELIIKSGCDSVKLTIAEDHPLTAETEEFKFILAPRIETD